MQSKPKTGRFKPCEVCGQDFWVVPARESIAKFCSRACKDNKPTVLVQHTCEQCKKSFQAFPSGRRRFCSRECSLKFRTFRQAGNCQICGTILDPKRNQFRFCSPECFAESRRTGQMVACSVCGTEVYRQPSELAARTNVFCSTACKGESERIDGPGASFRRTDGYIAVYYPAHPSAKGKRGAVMQHRLVMEGILGRYLRADEHVHHKNHVRDDNRPENLEVLTAREHQRETVQSAKKKRRADAARLAEYEKRFGPLD